MKGRLADTVGTNASKMVPETSGSTFSEDTVLQLLSPWQWGQQMPGWEPSLQMSDLQTASHGEGDDRLGYLCIMEMDW